MIRKETVEDDAGYRHVLELKLQALFVLAQRQFGELEGSNVATDAPITPECAMGVEYRLAADQGVVHPGCPA